MATVIQMDDVQPRSEDIAELRDLLHRIVGKPFLFLRASYDDELTIHLGRPQHPSNPRLRRPRGTFIITTRASAWMLEPGSPPRRFFASDEPELSRRAVRMKLDAIEEMPTIRPGSIVSRIDVQPSPDGLFLLLSFSDGSTIVLRPSPAEMQQGETGDSADYDAPLADWQIFMPEHRLLKAGPGNSWSYVASNVKLSERSAETVA